MGIGEGEVASRALSVREGSVILNLISLQCAARSPPPTPIVSDPPPGRYLRRAHGRPRLELDHPGPKREVVDQRPDLLPSDTAHPTVARDRFDLRRQLAQLCRYAPSQRPRPR